MPADFSTTDMSLTAYLFTIGHSPVDEGWAGGSYSWTFDSTPDLNDDVAAYYGGEVSINLQNYNRQVASLKNTVFGNSKRRA